MYFREYFICTAAASLGRAGGETHDCGKAAAKPSHIRPDCWQIIPQSEQVNIYTAAALAATTAS